MISLASDFRYLKDKFPDVEYICTSSDTPFRGYADHIGYFRFLGFARGNYVGDASGSGNYVPIHLFNINKIKADSGDGPYGKIVGEKAFELARLLTQTENGGAFISIEYALREMLRNAVEHSLGSKMAILGQFWPSKDIAEIVICDNGVGITETLKEHYALESDFDALEKAILPGVTGTSDLERKHQNPYYRNSGFGLYTTSKFCSERGVFRIISGNAGITLQANNSRRQSWRFDGTCIQIKIRTDDLENAATRIQSIIDEGEKLNKGKKMASTASKQTAGWIDALF